MSKGRAPRKPRSVKLLNGKAVTWDMVRSAYRERTRGRVLSLTQRKRDIRKLEDSFHHYDSVVTPIVDGRESARSVSKQSGHSLDTVLGWAHGRRMPREISLAQHEFKQKRLRQQLDLNLERHHELGYFLGAPAVGRLNERTNKRNGAIKFVVSTNSSRVADEIRRSAQRVFGVRLANSTPRRAKKSKNPTHEVALESANLVNYLSDKKKIGESPLDHLPDSPEARLGFTRAVYDMGKTWVAGRPGRKSVVLWHDEPRVREVISKSLHEQDIEHEIGEMRGKPAVIVRPEHAPAFKRAIRFRVLGKSTRLAK
jgi:hypothetical protein